MKLAINSFAECIGIANAITNTYTFVDKKVINMTIKKWSPLKVVSLVMVVSVKVCEEHGMQVMDNAERADAIINSYGLDINHWLNNSPYAHDVPAPVTDGIYAIQIPHDLPEHLARLIGHGVAVYHKDNLDMCVMVVMNKVNL